MSLALRMVKRSAAVATVSGMVMTVSMVVAPMSESSRSTEMVATAGVNIRSGPGTKHRVVGLLPRGKTIQALGGSQDGWTPVSLNGRKTWIASRYLAAAKQYQAAAAPAKSTSSASGSARTTAHLNARTGAGTQYRVSAILSRGAQVTLTGRASGEWRQIAHGGRHLWVSSRYLTTGAAAPAKSSSSSSGSTTASSSARTTASLNARTGAGTRYRVSTTLARGAAVNLTGRASGEWREIVHAGKRLWVSSRYLTGTSTPVKSQASGVKTSGSTPKVTGSRYATAALDIRSASSGGYTLTEVPAGTALNVTGVQANGRAQVVYQGAVRWVTARYLATKAPAPARDYSKGLTGLRSSAARIVTESRSRFPAITTYYGVRADTLPDHPSGRAVDIMIPNYRTSSGKATGKQIAEWAKSNAARLNVEYIIWDQHIWSTGRSREGWRWMASRGSDTANHKDHVHITVRN